MSELTREEQLVLRHKATEPPHTGRFTDFEGEGMYHCRACDAALYRSEDKFHSGCGWPSFDDELEGAVTRIPDADGRRIEIVCASCDGHLGHVFRGERLTDKNTRHCVNSISLRFEPAAVDTKLAWFAAGCFWGVEYHFQRAHGVLEARSGYMGGEVETPAYRDVCSGSTGHAEAVEVRYRPDQTDFRSLAKLFFEIHDPTQVNRQGPDIGSQYRSAVFYGSAEERAVVEDLIAILQRDGLEVATEVQPAAPFWPAEAYHQEYYARHAKEPYCHVYTKRFEGDA